MKEPKLNIGDKLYSKKPPPNLLPAVYSWQLHKIQRCVNSDGYALAVHGSMQRDFDLIAVPWEERAVSPEQLIRGLFLELGLKAQEGDPAEKEHGRLAYTLMLDGDLFIDLSIMPRLQALGGSDETN